MSTTSAFQFLTNAKLMLKMEIALSASRDTILLTDDVFFQSSFLEDLDILVVPLGTGTTRSAWLAPKIGSSTLTNYVCPSLTNAKPTPKMATVQNALMDMTWLKESACFLTSITLNLRIRVVELGTGLIRFA